MVGKACGEVMLFSVGL